ncbi:MAG: 23S rRNA (pseudouridine(1915)-N(3))-methyltransferase RlmH, partial [Salinimicrobium sediminis]|nr:23S rRNA (pseudouridine(1915)-N(3))-methyltransferase RlmH [Salinimicrobium sediminis]
MTIKLLTIGKTDDNALQNLIGTYVNRLGHYNKFELEIIADLRKTKNLSVEQQKAAEGKLILERLNTSDFVVLLDENGKQFSSEGFSEYIQKRLNSGMKQLIFIIGG